MKALVYHGPRDVQLDDKPHPNIQHPQDVILRVTSTRTGNGTRTNIRT